MSDKCAACGKVVYLTEKIQVEKKSFHKTCFKCDVCNNTLKLGNYAALSGKYYCKPHFKQLFQLKGNYSDGFGESKPTANWQVYEINKCIGGEKIEEIKYKSQPVTFRGLTLEQVEDAQEKFKKYDLDGSGTIDKDEFLKLMEELYPKKGKVLLKSLSDMHFNAADKDKSGAIDEVEFLKVYSELLLKEEGAK